MDVKFIIKCVVLILLLGGVITLLSGTVSSISDIWLDFLSFFGGVIIISTGRLGQIAGRIIASPTLFQFICFSFCVLILSYLVKWLFTGSSSQLK